MEGPSDIVAQALGYADAVRAIALDRGARPAAWSRSALLGLSWIVSRSLAIRFGAAFLLPLDIMGIETPYPHRVVELKGRVPS